MDLVKQDIVRLIADAYHEAATAEQNMKKATNAFETILLAMQEKNMFEAWLVIDEQVGLAAVDDLRPILEHLRNRFESHVISEIIRRLHGTFDRDPSAGRDEWLQEYIEALVQWRLPLCLGLSREGFAFPSDADKTVDLIKRATPYLLKRWRAAYHLFNHLAEQSLFSNIQRADMFVLAGQIQLYDFTKPDIAFVLFRCAEELAPNHVMIRYALGTYYMLQVDGFETAKDYFSQVVQIAPALPWGHIGLGVLYERRQMLGRAEEYYMDAIRKAKGWSTGYVYLYNLYGDPSLFYGHENNILSLVKTAIAVGPEGKYYRYIDVGEIYKRNGRYDKAHEWFHEAIKLDNTLLHAYTSEGYAYVEEKRYDQAVHAFEKAVEVEPDAFDGYYGMSWCYENQENWSEALKWYKESLILEPEIEGITRAKIGEMKWKSQMREEAESEMIQALRLEPGNELVLGLLHNIAIEYYKKLGDFQGAVRIYDQIRNIKGRVYDTDYYSNRVNMYVERRDWPEAKREVEEAFRMDNNQKEKQKRMALILAAKATQYLEYENYDKAIERYEEALKLDPDNAEIWANKGNVLNALRKFREAIECYDNALSIDPKYADVWMDKGYSLHYLRRYIEAIECYDKVLEIRPDDTAVWTRKGISLRKLERYEEAEECYDKALERQPDDAYTLNVKAYLFAHINRNDEALGLIERSLEIDPNNPKSLDTKGFILHNLDEYDKAIKCYEEAIAIDPYYSVAWKHKADTLQKLGRIKDAGIAVNKAKEFDISRIQESKPR